MVVGVASSTTINGTYTWLDEPIHYTNGLPITGSFVESPFILKYGPSISSDAGAVWQLFLMKNGLEVLTSSTIEGPWETVATRNSVPQDMDPQFNCSNPIGLARIANEIILYEPLPAFPDINRRYMCGLVYDAASIERIEFWEYDPKTYTFAPFLV
jgi:hypothetical protein